MLSAWSPHFRERFEGHPIKSVVLSFGSFCQQGEFIAMKEGVEGSLIYATSALLRDEISKQDPKRENKLTNRLCYKHRPS